MRIYVHTKINVEPECLRKDFGWPRPKQGGMISPFLKLPVHRIHISTSHMMKSSSSSSISYSTLMKKTLRIHNRKKIKHVFGQNIPLLSGSGGIALAHVSSCQVLEDAALLWNTRKLFSIQTNTKQHWNLKVIIILWLLKWTEVWQHPKDLYIHINAMHFNMKELLQRHDALRTTTMSQCPKTQC